MKDNEHTRAIHIEAERRMKERWDALMQQPAKSHAEWRATAEERAKEFVEFFAPEEQAALRESVSVVGAGSDSRLRAETQGGGDE